jgi:hypothetical protein
MMSRIPVDYESGSIKINLEDLLARVETDRKLEMIESMSCSNDLIDYVAQQIIERWTDNGYSGGTFVTALAEPTTGLDKAWREVAKASGDVAKREILRLEGALKAREKELNDLRDDMIARNSRFG